jgi:hypothetical protein
MRVYGRITLFGEYYMHLGIYGLSVKSNLYLEPTYDVTPLCNLNYSKGKDTTLKELCYTKKLSTVQYTITGNLPLGYGLAGSTCLSYLHIMMSGNKYQSKNLINILSEVDSRVHGFTSSGLDAYAVVKQSSGMYSNRAWIKTDTSKLKNFLLITLQKQIEHPLSKILRTVQASSDLKILNVELGKYWIKNNTLDMDMFKKYCNCLNDLGIYTCDAKRIIALFLEKGICAKCIGGLYNKAIVVFAHRNEVNAILNDSEILYNLYE